MNKMKFKSIISLSIIVIPAFIFGFMDKTAEMGIMVIASSVASLFLNIDIVKDFTVKSGELKATMKDTILEANETIDTLKEVAKPLIVSTLNEINWSGRVGGLNQQQKHSLKNDIEKVINKFNINDEKVNEVLKEFYRFNSWDHYYYLKEEIFRSRAVNIEQREKLNSKFNIKSNNFPSKEFILDILNIQEKDLNLNEQKRLDDYLYYLENHKLSD